jgi:putative thioredoxin
VGGQPVPLFQGIPPEPEIRQVLDQVLELAAKSGVNGSLTPVAGESLDEAAEPPLPPLHQEAFDALVRNDLAGAKSAYERQLAQTPGDTEAEAGLAQVLLLERVSDLDPAAVREAAAQDPSSVEAALNIADLDISGGHVEDACFRLLTLYPTLDEAGKEIVRTRLLSYFVVAGPTTDAVKRARNQLSSLMF